MVVAIRGGAFVLEVDKGKYVAFIDHLVPVAIVLA